MRTSLNDIREIEAHINATADPGERLIMQARFLISDVWRSNYFLQKKIEQLVRIFSRNKIREEVKQAHEQLFSDPGKKEWKERILQNFNQ